MIEKMTRKDFSVSSNSSDNLNSSSFVCNAKQLIENTEFSSSEEKFEQKII